MAIGVGLAETKNIVDALSGALTSLTGIAGKTGSELTSALTLEGVRSNLVEVNKSIYDLSKALSGISTGSSAAERQFRNLSTVYGDLIVKSRGYNLSLKESVDLARTLNMTIGGMVASAAVGQDAMDRFGKSLVTIFRNEAPEAAKELTSIIRELPVLTEKITNRMALSFQDLNTIQKSLGENAMIMASRWSSSFTSATERTQTLRDAIMSLKQQSEKVGIEFQTKNIDQIVAFTQALRKGLETVADIGSTLSGWGKTLGPGTVGGTMAGATASMAIAQLPRVLWSTITSIMGLKHSIDRNTDAVDRSTGADSGMSAVRPGMIERMRRDTAIGLGGKPIRSGMIDPYTSVEIGDEYYGFGGRWGRPKAIMTRAAPVMLIGGMVAGGAIQAGAAVMGAKTGIEMMAAGQQAALENTNSAAMVREQQGATTRGGMFSGALQGAGTLAMSGAMIGSMFAPVIGTAIGGAIGGIIGIVGGAFYGFKKSAEAASKALDTLAEKMASFNLSQAQLNQKVNEAWDKFKNAPSGTIEQANAAQEYMNYKKQMMQEWSIKAYENVGLTTAATNLRTAGIDFGDQLRQPGGIIGAENERRRMSGQAPMTDNDDDDDDERKIYLKKMFGLENMTPEDLEALQNRINADPILKAQIGNITTTGESPPYTNAMGGRWTRTITVPDYAQLEQLATGSALLISGNEAYIAGNSPEFGEAYGVKTDFATIQKNLNDIIQVLRPQSESYQALLSAQKQFVELLGAEQPAAKLTPLWTGIGASNAGAYTQEEYTTKRRIVDNQLQQAEYQLTLLNYESTTLSQGTKAYYDKLTEIYGKLAEMATLQKEKLMLTINEMRMAGEFREQLATIAKGLAEWGMAPSGESLIPTPGKSIAQQYVIPITQQIEEEIAGKRTKIEAEELLLKKPDMTAESRREAEKRIMSLRGEIRKLEYEKEIMPYKEERGVLTAEQSMREVWVSAAPSFGGIAYEQGLQLKGESLNKQNEIVKQYQEEFRIAVEMNVPLTERINKMTELNNSLIKQKQLTYDIYMYGLDYEKTQIELTQSSQDLALQVAQTFKLPITEQMPIMKEQMSSALDMIVNKYKQIRLMQPNSVPWLNAHKELNGLMSQYIQKLDYVRNTWEQQLTETAIFAPEGSYTTGGVGLSEYQTKGSGYYAMRGQYGPAFEKTGGITGAHNLMWGSWMGAQMNDPRFSGMMQYLTGQGASPAAAGMIGKYGAAGGGQLTGGLAGLSGLSTILSTVTGGIPGGGSMVPFGPWSNPQAGTPGAAPNLYGAAAQPTQTGIPVTVGPNGTEIGKLILDPNLFPKYIASVNDNNTISMPGGMSSVQPYAIG